MSRKPDKLSVEEAAWLRAVSREKVIRPLALLPRLSAAHVGRACRELKLGQTRFYELLNQYRASPVTSSLLDAISGPSKGRTLLSPDIEEIIQAAIRDTYRKRERPTVTALHDRVRQVCDERGVRAPSWTAVRARVDCIDPAILLQWREGAKAAKQKFGSVVQEYNADYALQIVQIDHTLVDVFIVDAVSRKPLQRPWLTLAIDIASRMVAGFYLSLERPSSTSVALAIQNVVMPKAPRLQSMGVDVVWPVFGLPDVIHLDNGAEFHGKALVRGAAEHGIELMYRPVARPHYGGHIERLIGTMMGAVHLLPGSTSSNIAKRGSYDPQKHAAMTLDELERWLVLQIVGRYHADVHSVLLLPPRTAWDDAKAARSQPVRLPHDPERFLLDFLPYKERCIRRDGLHLFGIRYWDDVLSPFAGRSSRQLRVKYDPRDLSCVYLEQGDGSMWPVRFAALDRPAITLGEHRLARATLRARGASAVDEQLIFQTIAEQRRLMESAVQQTRAMRRHTERTERGLAAFDRTTDLPESNDEDDVCIDISPLSVEEWS
ncbi:Mu transposase C-terminal domain-containing protein (plasmid) [Rhizobium sp. CB3090]|uniref:Mu transposase C-terminal domain-containing protein n=1 Tax=Rhizobium sp. CB3090 TaxID=3039156 RepID=UPI0024B16FD8|nr:Mu transposase C-terminal domain-containing protein [Rhizobium sp. CB3090]WFU13003.1 Mu transposase C-terminal domain-containing protein [Rhizobium sp. CB3090]WFU13326.1 Mu transposase C-terminal domain-containing protein [Rhizobium sp. CB3090]